MLPLPELCKHIRRQRLLLGMTQAELAQAGGTSQSLIAKLEQGRLNPSYETVRRLYNALEQRGRAAEPTAQELMQQHPMTAAPDEPLRDALQRMKAQGYSQMPVLEQGRAVGSLSERAVLERIERGESIEDLRRRPVAEIMDGGFPTVEPTASRRMLVELLRENDAVLVVAAGRMVGVVTKSDLW
jgi:predicted transcriptional regulator